jgi:hypothetical protein
VVVSVLRSVARRRLVKTKNHSASATVNCRRGKSAKPLYLNVIKGVCNQVLLNPIIRTRAVLLVSCTTLHVTI